MGDSTVVKQTSFSAKYVYDNIDLKSSLVRNNLAVNDIKQNAVT